MIRKRRGGGWDYSHRVDSYSLRNEMRTNHDYNEDEDVLDMSVCASQDSARGKVYLRLVMNRGGQYTEAEVEMTHYAARYLCQTILTEMDENEKGAGDAAND